MMSFPETSVTPLGRGAVSGNDIIAQAPVEVIVLRTVALPGNKYRAFYQRLNDRWRLVFDVGIATGWRISDILGLRPCDLKDDGSVSMTARKTGKTAAAVLPVSLVSRLKRNKGQFWLFPSPVDSTFPVTRQAAYKAFNRASVRIGLSGIAPHSMRRSFAQGLLSTGMSIQDIQKALQHDKIETTLLYLLNFERK